PSLLQHPVDAPAARGPGHRRGDRQRLRLRPQQEEVTRRPTGRQAVSRCVALVGGGGQLARDLIAHWAAERPSERLVPLDHAAVEVSDEDLVRSVMEQTRPDVVINTAAYHKVDQVEDDPDRAFAVNAIGVRNLARACQAMDAVLVHLSTDYVFSGPHSRPYEESDPPNPVNVYG